MCAVSNVGDNWTKKFGDYWPITPITAPSIPSYPVIPGTSIPSVTIDLNQVTRQEFEELKNLVLEMKKELVEARRQDIANNEPDCEMEDKVAVLKKIAKMVGVSLEEVFPESK